MIIVSIQTEIGFWEKRVVVPDDADERSVMDAARTAWLEHRASRLSWEDGSHFKEMKALAAEIIREEGLSAASRPQLKLVR